MEQHQLKALQQRLTPRLTKYIPHYPHAKQQAFLLLNCKDAFYGGAAGGGKSDALLMAALQYVDLPGYAALLIRDTFANLVLPGALMDRADQWLSGTDAKWEGDSKSWRFPSGSTLTFGYMDSPRDHLKYKSAEFQFIGFDEASDLRWSQIIYLFSRLRKLENVSVPLRFRLASNPGGISHNEIKARYVDKETRRTDCIYIPAGLSDNPYLNKEEYTDSLMNLDPITREQLLKGDWDIREKGRMFDRSWFRFKEQPFPEDEIVARVRYWDLAATEKKINSEPAYTAGVKIAKTKSGQYLIENVIRERKEPGAIEQLIRQASDMDGKKTNIWMEQEPGSGGKNTISHYRRNIIPDFVFHADKVIGSKASRAAPFSSQVEAGNVFLLKAYWNESFIEEAEMFPDGKFKDQIDSASGAYSKVCRDVFGGIRVNTISSSSRSQNTIRR